MKKIYFKVKFLSDIVLQATSNNEGKIEQLDFIPGNNFLGIVAKDYDKFDNPFSVFHSNKVRFSDATIVIDNKLTYKMPLSFFHKKLDDKTLYNHHLIKDFIELGQLKQKRKNYITRDLEEVVIEYKYSQKSAYDKEKRRSKDSSMYGYKAIKKGTIWQFYITYDESVDMQKIKQSLLGKQRLGKSRSAEYGLIEISESTKRDEVATKESKEYDYLYLKSRVALFDKNNFPTFDVKYLAENLKVIYEKTQIKTSTFTPYNRARQTKDYERAVISSGSVIVVEKLTPAQKEEILKGVGGYLNEGFGEILINPSFLFENEFNLKKLDKQTQKNSSSAKSDTIKFLENRQKNDEELVKTLQKVEENINSLKKVYSNITKSQWGRVRAVLNSDDNYKDTIIKYISKGVKKWTDIQIQKFTKILDENKDYILLIVLRLQKEAK